MNAVTFALCIASLCCSLLLLATHRELEDAYDTIEELEERVEQLELTKKGL